VGLSLIHKREDMIRSVFEGVALALRDVLEVFKENGLSVQELALSGGGAMSPFWNKMMSSIYDRPVKIPASPKQATSLGAAIAAAVGAGLFPDYESASSLVQFERNYRPDPSRSGVYEHVFREYQSLYKPYAELSGELSSYQNKFFEGE
jgi:xylulokinase